MLTTILKELMKLRKLKAHNKIFMHRIILNSVSVFLAVSCCYTKEEYYSDSSDGEKKLEYRYEVNRLNGEKCGKFVWFYYSGDTLQKSYFKDDKLYGVSRSYFEHNKLHHYIECFNDLRHGITREYYQNGQLHIECIYDMDRLWEVRALYDSTGNKLDFGNLKDGNGFIKSYYLGGSLEHEGGIKNGVRHGQWRFYTNTGVLMNSFWYVDGRRPDSEIIENQY